MDNAFQKIAIQGVEIHYPMDTVIQPLNNWDSTYPNLEPIEIVLNWLTNVYFISIFSSSFLFAGFPIQSPQITMIRMKI